MFSLQKILLSDRPLLKLYYPPLTKKESRKLLKSNFAEVLETHTITHHTAQAYQAAAQNPSPSVREVRSLTLPFDSGFASKKRAKLESEAHQHSLCTVKKMLSMCFLCIVLTR